MLWFSVLLRSRSSLLATSPSAPLSILSSVASKKHSPSSNNSSPIIWQYTKGSLTDPGGLPFQPPTSKRHMVNLLSGERYKNPIGKKLHSHQVKKKYSSQFWVTFHQLRQRLPVTRDMRGKRMIEGTKDVFFNLDSLPRSYQELLYDPMVNALSRQPWPPHLQVLLWEAKQRRAFGSPKWVTREQLEQMPGIEIKPRHTGVRVTEHMVLYNIEQTSHPEVLLHPAMLMLAKGGLCLPSSTG